MSIPTPLQAVMQRLSRDGAFRQRFLAAPERVLAAQPLTAEERRALLRLRARLLAANGTGAWLDSVTGWP